MPLLTAVQDDAQSWCTSACVDLLQVTSNLALASRKCSAFVSAVWIAICSLQLLTARAAMVDSDRTNVLTWQ